MIGPALALGSAVTQGVSGLFQTSKANKELEELGERPDYVIPQGAQASLALAQKQSQEGIPDATMNIFEANQNKIASQTAANMGDLRAGLSGVQGAAGASASSARDLAVADAEQRIRNTRNLMDKQEMIAGYQEREQEENVLGRYDVARAESLGRLNRGQQEKMSALQSLVNAGSLFGVDDFTNIFSRNKSETPGITGGGAFTEEFDQYGNPIIR
jgi:hypothetical protein